MNARRAVAGVVVSVPEPAISQGHPTLPPYWAKFPASAVLKEGPLHIRAITDPNPVWDPATSGWTVFPPAISSGANGAGDYRWAVDTLPDPAGYPNGWYWLGDPSSSDGTAGIESGARQWAANPGAPGPAWRSFFPFKPSVSAYDAYIPGSPAIHHSKGVHFNSHYIEHMWLDFGGSRLQPCTWIVVANVMSDPFPGYQHSILDSGRNPDDVGFPRLSGGDVALERTIADGLPYRTSVQAQANAAAMLTKTGDGPLRTRTSPGHHPRMYAMIFNGRSSRLAVYDPFGKNQSVGAVSSGPSFVNRYTVMGRQQGWISQNHAANLLVFEIRFWHYPLTNADLDSQYAQLSSTYQFDQYRNL